MFPQLNRLKHDEVRTTKRVIKSVSPAVPPGVDCAEWVDSDVGLRELLLVVVEKSDRELAVGDAAGVYQKAVENV